MPAKLGMYTIHFSEPPKKKRKSKWGIKPEDLQKESTTDVAGVQASSDNVPVEIQGPKGAEAAAAKLNAMLAAQGKLVKSDPPATKPILVSFTEAGLTF